MARPSVKSSGSAMVPPEDSAFEGKKASFPETLWSKVLVVQGGSSQDASEALAKLCQSYWYPLYAFIRSRGYPLHDAQDLTQAFFAFLLSGDALQNVDRKRGRFRAFLLGSLDHFLVNEWKKGQTEKRGGKQLSIPWEQLDEAHFPEDMPVQDSPPAKIYDRNWAGSLIGRVLETQKKEFTRVGKSQHFEIFRGFLPGSPRATSHAEAASALNLTRTALDVALHRFRQRFGKLLREEVAQTVAKPDDIDDEIQYLLSAWAGEEV
jgi:RNA polymerase sigma-70 factor (ECF subfamily)